MFLPHLMRRPEAHIANISSIFGIVGVPGQTSYCASKFAVRGFGGRYKRRLLNTPVGVTVVHPGGVATQVVSSARTNDEQMKSHMVDAFQKLAFRQIRWHDKLCWHFSGRRRLGHERGGCRDWFGGLSRWGESVDGETVDSILGLRKLFDAQQARMYDLLIMMAAKTTDAKII